MGKISAKKLSKLNTDQLADILLKTRKKDTSSIPANYFKNSDIDELVEMGRKCYRILPKKDFNGTYIIYLYGGYMCKPIDQEQWDFISRLADNTDMGFLVPMYPIAPENCCKDVFEMLIKMYSNFSKGIDVKKLIIMGYSSGAGLALSLAIAAWDNGLRKPDELILLSPVLDTEFFDRDLEEKIKEASAGEDRYFFNNEAKEFINKYWVKDYAVKTEYTSPFYEDYTDICNDIVLFSGVEDMFSAYNTAFYKKAKGQGLNIRFFEMKNANHNLMIYDHSRTSADAFRYLCDVLNNTYNNSLLDIFPIKLMSDWSKRFPDLIRADSASNFVYSHKFDFSGLQKPGEFKNLVLAANYISCDHCVGRYIMEYPNCTVVQVGCKLDDMFARLDNGRIQWYTVGDHNTMAVRRAIYGVHDREKTIGRNLLDFSWMDEINCVRKKGLIFVFNETLNHIYKHQVKALFEKLLEKFPGAQVVFTTTTYMTRTALNMSCRIGLLKREKRTFSVDDVSKTLAAWKTEYEILYEDSTLNCFEDEKEFNIFTKLKMAYSRLVYNYKVVNIRLGGESYDIMI